MSDKQVNKVVVRFQNSGGDFASKQFDTEDSARDFMSQHPVSFIVVDKRAFLQGGENG